MLGAFVWTERLLLFQNLFTKISTKNASITNLHFFARKIIIIYGIDKSTTATAFKGKLYTNTMRLVFLVHIEFTKRRHLSICDTMMSTINLTQNDIASVDRKSNKRLCQQASWLNLNAELYFSIVCSLPPPPQCLHCFDWGIALSDVRTLFLTIRSSLYTLFLSLKKSKITHRFWAFSQFIRAICPALHKRHGTGNTQLAPQQPERELEK